MSEMPAPQIEPFKETNNDPGFLAAKGRFQGSPDEVASQEKTHRKKLTKAILRAMSNHGYAKIRAVGSNAIANACRAITSASQKCTKDGIELYWSSSFEHGNLGPLRDPAHVKNVVAILFTLRYFKDVGENHE